MNNETELLPCPFCGDSDVAVFHNTCSDQRHNWDYDVQCHGCGATSPSEQQEADAISAWNRRATLPTTGAAVVVPELPKPEIEGGYYDAEEGYTADQMRAYALKAIATNRPEPAQPDSGEGE